MACTDSGDLRLSDIKGNVDGLRVILCLLGVYCVSFTDSCFLLLQRYRFVRRLPEDWQDVGAGQETSLDYKNMYSLLYLLWIFLTAVMINLIAME